MVVARQENGMAFVNQTRLHCVNHMGKTQSKPFGARHGKGTAWEMQGMCELALMVWKHGITNIMIKHIITTHNVRLSHTIQFLSVQQSYLAA
jgi:hypothetical protein